MNAYLDLTKLLQEGKITQSEFQRIKSLSSKWDSSFIPCFFVALFIIVAPQILIGPFIFFAPIIILTGVLVLALEHWITKC